MRSIIFALSALLTAPVVATPDPLEASIEELQHWLTSGELTSVELVEFYLDRIEAYDQRGPALNAVQHLSADALDQAKALDTERANGAVRSRLHGIPVLIKDNYETVDAPTTAGSSIIDGHWPRVCENSINCGFPVGALDDGLHPRRSAIPGNSLSGPTRRLH